MVKEDIINLCDEFVEFWSQFKEEMSLVNDNETEIALKWHNYFESHNKVVSTLVKVKMNIDSIDEKLMKQGKMKYDT